MRAATIRDGSIAVEEHPDPVPGDSDLLVRVHGAGLNGADMLQLKGFYPAPPGAPQDIPGLEALDAGAALDHLARQLEPGDRVMSIVAGTGIAVRSCTTASSAWPPPATIDITRSPGSKRWTPGPHSTTSPASSSPGMSCGAPGGAG